MNTKYLNNNNPNTATESPARVAATALMAMLATIAILALMIIAAPPAHAEQQFQWRDMIAKADSKPAIPYGPGCLVCKAETSSPVTTCGSESWAKASGWTWFNTYNPQTGQWCISPQVPGVVEVDNKANVRFK